MSFGATTHDKARSMSREALASGMFTHIARFVIPAPHLRHTRACRGYLAELSTQTP